jgi:hypothetical protein
MAVLDRSARDPISMAGLARRAAASALLVVSIAGADRRLELTQALPLDGPALVQPSGLAWDGKDLVLISSVHDDDIFKIEIQADKAMFRERTRIRRPKDAAGKMAWRGLAPDGKGNLFLVSEAACRIMKVEPDGDAEWEGPGLLELGVEMGLFAGENSGVEGIIVSAQGKYLVAAAREPRGLIQVDLAAAPVRIRAMVADKSDLALPKGRRKADFADLAQDKGQTWALAANADAVTHLKWTGKEYAEAESWTFGHVTNDAKYRYMGLRMGLARGLAMDGESIYVVLDNKGVGRQADITDKRPLLLVFKRPAGV